MGKNNKNKVIEIKERLKERECFKMSDENKEEYYKLIYTSLIKAFKKEDR